MIPIMQRIAELCDHAWKFYAEPTVIGLTQSEMDEIAGFKDAKISHVLNPITAKMIPVKLIADVVPLESPVEKAKRETLAEAREREYKMVDRAYADLRQAMAKTKDDSFPHCDEWVLHSPGTCVYCDKHAKWQRARIELGILFTNDVWPEGTLGLRPCPATLFRPAEKIHRWGGNIPRDEVPTALVDPGY